MSLQEFGEKWIDVDGIRTRYFEAGEGRTIVLVHGGTKGDASGGANAEDFHLNFAELAKNFRVISRRSPRPGLHRQSQARRGLHDGRRRCGISRGS